MRSVSLFVVIAVLASAACHTPGLEAVSSGLVVLDDLLQVNANVCTSVPADTVFPVKVLFVVDTSDSMTVTDRQGLRARAVTQVMQRFAGNPAVQFGVIAFDAVVDVLTPGFTNTPDIGTINARLANADRLTDYEGALGAAYTLLANDMQAASPADRARTKYVVIFFTDGVPDPQCSATAQDSDLVCEVPKENWASAFAPPLDPSLYPALQAGGDYNQPAQIYKSVDDIIALQDVYRVAEVRLHTALLFDPAVAADPLAIPFRLDRPTAVNLLTQIAMHGQGTYSEFSNASSISFLNFNYTSIQEPSALASFMATDLNTSFTKETISPDTDGDGLIDSVEFALGTCPGLSAKCSNPADSDGDSYSDFFEDHFRSSGFDPLNNKLPAQACKAKGDTDGDGLRDCEEQYIGTDIRLFDSDGDRLTDWQELVMGLNPLDPNDAVGDADNDAMRNNDEIRAHLNPNERNAPDGEAKARYLYSVETTETRPDGRVCYATQVSNIHLLTTGGGTNSPRGVQRIMLYFIEAPNDRPLDFGNLRQACVETRYVSGAVKYPPNGVVDLTDDNFIKPTNFNADRDCVKTDASAN